MIKIERMREKKLLKRKFYNGKKHQSLKIYFEKPLNKPNERVIIFHIFYNMCLIIAY